VGGELQEYRPAVLGSYTSLIDLPNAQVLLQAQLTMRAQRAIQKCLAAATFVRRQTQTELPEEHPPVKNFFLRTYDLNPRDDASTKATSGVTL
jgi:hypothetical protein